MSSVSWQLLQSRPTCSCDFLLPQSKSAVLDGGREQLQKVPLDKDQRWLLLMEQEKQRVASMRRMQVESEQFRYFEDQLRRQELASQRGGEVGPNVTLYYCWNAAVSAAAVLATGYNY